MTDLQILQTLLTEFPYPLLGSIVAGVLCAYLGVYVVSRRVVFVGATLTQVAVAGIALAHLPVFLNVNHIVGSVVVTLLVVMIFSRLLQSRTISRDSVLGISFVAAVAFRILLIQKSPAVEVSEIESILKGDILFVTAEQFYLLLGVFVIVMAVHLLFYKEFIFVSFDSETATTQGFPAKKWDLFFYLTVGLAISVATRIVGDAFVFGFLVLPAVTAMLAGNKVRTIFIVSIVVGILSPVLGLYGAFKYDLPAGPTAVAMGSGFLFVGWMWKKFFS